MKKLILLIAALVTISLNVKSQDTIRGIQLNHTFYKVDSTELNGLFETVSYSVDKKMKVISCRVKFYANRSDANKDTLSLIVGSDIMINDQLYRLNYSGTSYSYDVLPDNVYTDAINHCVNDINYYNLLVPPYPNGIKPFEIIKY